MFRLPSFLQPDTASDADSLIHPGPMADLIAVDDEPAILRMLAEALEPQGHRLRTARRADELDRLLAEDVPDLVILDLGLPGEDGFSIARRLRQQHDIGIVMLTGAGDLVDRVAGLEVGADDYVTKPFSLAELNARIAAVLRRRRLAGPEILPFGPLSLDLQRWRVLDAGGSPLPLFPTEVDLVAAFATNRGRLLSRDDLLRLAPAHGDDPLDRSIDTRITRLRRKLELAGIDGRLIQSSRGNGYIYRGAPD